MKKRDLVQILLQEGWYLIRSSKHEIWGNGDLTEAVPHGNDISKYTAEKILKKVYKAKGNNARKR